MSHPKIPKFFRVRRRGGFTLSELLVVIAIVAMLAVLALPSVNSALLRQKHIQSLANMKSITAGLLLFASDNECRFPSSVGPSAPAWDTQILPYLDFQHDPGYSGLPTVPVTSGTPLSSLKVFRCPLDRRKQAAGYYPRSYGVSGVTFYPVDPWSGGIPNRQIGEGISLTQIQKPASFVLLCRIGRNWEMPGNVVGIGDNSAVNGPPTSAPNDPDWRIFEGKTPYGFTDGHIILLNPVQAAEVDPSNWTYGN